MSAGESSTGAGHKRGRSNTEDLTCSICSDLYQAPVTLKNCGHTFCLYCIDRWLKAPTDSNNTRCCPTCRANIVEISSWPPAIDVALQSMAVEAEESNPNKDDVTSRLLRTVGSEVPDIALRVAQLLSLGACPHTSIGNDSAMLVACRDRDSPTVAQQLLASMPSSSASMSAADLHTSSRALRHVYRKTGPDWQAVGQGLEQRGATLPDVDSSDEDDDSDEDDYEDDDEDEEDHEEEEDDDDEEEEEEDNEDEEEEEVADDIFGSADGDDNDALALLASDDDDDESDEEEEDAEVQAVLEVHVEGGPATSSDSEEGGSEGEYVPSAAEEHSSHEEEEEEGSEDL